MTTIGSLCTGYGGLDMALEKFTGGRTVWVSDVDKDVGKILDARFPDAPNLGDIKTIDWDTVPRVDWLTAGYPCQPFSHAGKREGVNDPRHIWPWIAEGIRELRPRHVLLENVRGHLTRGFDVVLGSLADMGYDVRWGVVRASDAGAPHRRERIFILASNGHREGLQGTQPAPGRDLSDGRAPADASRDGRNEGRPEPEGLVGGSDAPERRRATPPDAGRERHGAREIRPGVPLLDGADAHGAPERERSREVPGDRGVAAAGNPEGVGVPHESDRGPAEGLPLGPVTGAEPGDREGATPPRVRVLGGTPEELGGTFGPYAAAVHRWERVTRPAPNPTEPTGRGGAHRLSPAFVEWMMGLPEGHVTDVGLSRNAQLKALGNGVVPQQAFVALSHLTASLA